MTNPWFDFLAALQNAPEVQGAGTVGEMLKGMFVDPIAQRAMPTIYQRLGYSPEDAAQLTRGNFGEWKAPNPNDLLSIAMTYPGFGVTGPAAKAPVGAMARVAASKAGKGLETAGETIAPKVAQLVREEAGAIRPGGFGPSAKGAKAASEIAQAGGKAGGELRGFRSGMGKAGSPRFPSPKIKTPGLAEPGTGIESSLLEKLQKGALPISDPVFSDTFGQNVVDGVERLAASGLVEIKGGFVAGKTPIVRLTEQGASLIKPKPAAPSEDILGNIGTSLRDFHNNRVSAQRFIQDRITPYIRNKYGDAPLIYADVPYTGVARNVYLDVATGGWEPRLKEMGFTPVPNRPGLWEMPEAPRLAGAGGGIVPPKRPTVTAPLGETPPGPMWGNPEAAVVRGALGNRAVPKDVNPPVDVPVPAARLPVELPSGKAPGGAQNITPPSPPDQLAQIRQALTPDKQPFWQKVLDTKDRLLRATYDKNLPLVALSKQSGLPVHELAQVIPGKRAAGEWAINSEFEPVIGALGKDIKTLETYMAIRRSEDILARNPSASLPGGVSGWAGQRRALAQLQAEVGPQRFAAVEDAAQRLWGPPGSPEQGLLYQHILKPLLDEGILKPEAVRAITSSNPHYLDWHRLDAALGGTPRGGAGTGSRVGGSPVASLSNTGIDQLLIGGSERKLDEPLARTLAQVISVQERVARNKTARFLVDALNRTGVEVTPHTGVSPAGQGAISYFQDGQKLTVNVPKVYADVAKGLDNEAAGWFGNFLGRLAQPLRTGATTYNPAFVLINPIRDAITAGFIKGWRTVLSPEYMQGWAAALTKNTLFGDAARDGALMSGIIDSFTSTKDLTRVAARRVWGIPVDSVGDAAKFVPRLIREINTASERATRIGTYLRLKNQGSTGLQAAIGARGVTVDFAKSGNVVKVINQAIPFLNAGVQGAANTLKVMRTDPKQALIRAAPLVAGSVLFDLWNRRFASSNLIPDYEYRNNWIVVVGEGQTAPDPKTKKAETYPVYLKIPKGPTGALLTLPAEMVLRWQRATGDYSLAGDLLATVGAAGETLSPVSVSPSSMMLPGVGTATEMAFNKSLYTGREIVPLKEQPRPPELQYGPESSRQAVAIGKLLGISPRMMDYAVKDYLAGTGQAGNWLVDVALGAAGYNPPIPGEMTAQKKTGAEALSQTPVVSRFLGAKNTEPEIRAYKLVEQRTLESNRKMVAEYPITVRLGITMGRPYSSYTLNGRTVDLTPDQQATLAETAYVAAKPYLDAALRVPGFARLKPEDQKERIQAALKKGMDAARAKLPKASTGTTAGGGKSLALPNYIPNYTPTY